MHSNGTTDAQLRQALRLTKSAPEVWAETDAWRPRWEAIELAAKQEKIANGEAVSSAVPDEATAAARDAASAARQLEENVRGGILHVLEAKTLPWYRACAYRAVRTYISLAAEPELPSVLKTNIMNCPLKDIHGTANRKCVVFLFDATTIGEAANHPQWRFPALSEGRVRKLISSALGARNGGMDTCVPCEGDVFLLLDGGRSSESTLLTPFRMGISDVDGMAGPRKKATVEGDVRAITLGFLENSVFARRARVRGDFDLRQTAKMYMVTTKGLKVPPKTYPDYPTCTPKGDLIMPIQLPSHSDTTIFNVRPQDRAAIWGPFRPTSPTSVAAAATEAAGATTETKEPVCYHGMSKTFYNSVFDALSVAGVCDLSVGGGAAAEAALARKLPYYGICPTEHHVKAAQDWLAERTLALMADSSSSFYDAEYAKLRVRADGTKSTNAASSSATGPAPGPTPNKPPKKTEETKDSLIMLGLSLPLSLATVGCVLSIVSMFVCLLGVLPKESSTKRKRASSSSSSDSCSE